MPECHVRTCFPGSILLLIHWRKAHLAIKAEAIGTVNLELTEMPSLNPICTVSWSYKTLEREHFCYIFLEYLEAQVWKTHATVCYISCRHFKFESFLPAETWVLWVFFSLWLIGKPAYTPSEQKKVCREEGNQCNASHLSADFFHLL